MEPFSLNFAAEACGGELLRGSPEALVRGVSTDSRQLRSGELFVALRGERFDGHDFLARAAAEGVQALLVGRARADAAPADCAVILVDNTRVALGRLAAAHRRRWDLPVIAVGGSNGKTTTKELIAAVLRQQRRTLWSEASFNNDIGVPLTLLRLEAAHEVAVLEVGTNHPGELAPLVRLAQPRFGVLTSIGREHLEFFGDVAGVAQEEGSLAELLPSTGRLFLNGDTEWADSIARRSRAGVTRVGFGEGNDWRAADARMTAEGMTFAVNAPAAGFSGEYRIQLLGRHQVTNALFALAVGAEFGLSPAAVRAGLAECPPPKMRMQLWEHNDVRVLDDAYNANTDSMVAALQTLAELPCAGRRIAVLGDMLELGPQSETAHLEVGRFAATAGIGQLFTVGRMAPVLARGAREAGLLRVLEFASVETAAGVIRNFLKPGDLVLLKASRGTRLENLADKLRATVPRKN